MKGYERLLSLSKDVDNARWKPLHISGNWNAKNRRMAKLKTKNSWFKGRQEVELPGETEAREGPEGSRLDTTLVPPPMQEQTDTIKTVKKSPRKVAKKGKKRKEC